MDTSINMPTDKRSLPSATATSNSVPSRAWLAAVDRYYDRLDQPSLKHSRSQQLRTDHRQSSQWRADFWLEPLSDFAMDS
jgi:hypothetical protein